MLQHAASHWLWRMSTTRCNMLQHAATCCNTFTLKNVYHTLQHTATRCTTLQHIDFGEWLPYSEGQHAGRLKECTLISMCAKTPPYMYVHVCICETPSYINARTPTNESCRTCDSYKWVMYIWAPFIYLPRFLRMSHVTHVIHVWQDSSIHVSHDSTIYVTWLINL